MSLKTNDEYNENMFEQALEILGSEMGWVNNPGKIKAFFNIPLDIRLQAIKQFKENK